MTRNGERDDENIDRHQIERENPSCFGHIALIAIFNDGDMELARQQKNAAGRQQHGCERSVEIRRISQDSFQNRIGGSAFRQIRKTVKHAPGDVSAHTDEGEQFHNGFCGDREHQSILVLGRIDMARAKGHGEAGKQQGHEECSRPRAR